MAKEITIVTLIDGECLSLEETKGFEDCYEAEQYFIEQLKKKFPEDVKNWKHEDFYACLDDGYYEDMTHFCLYISQIKVY